MRNLGRMIANACLTAMLLGGVTATSAEAQAPLPTGKATAAAVFATYSDRDTFTNSSTAVPPSTYVAYATGGFDNTGEGVAQAALFFNPYQDLLSASNGVCQEVKTCKEAPVSPADGADTFRSKNRASVRGQAPQKHDASLSPGNPQVAAGTMRAALDEKGPAANADTLTAGGQLVPGVSVTAAASLIKVDLSGGRAITVATSILQGVTIAEALTFESVVVEATSAPDGAGKTIATVQVTGAAVNGTPVVLTDTGVVVADQSTPVDSGEVAGALEQAGIELVAPGQRSAQPGADEALAEARGPSFRLTGSEGQRLQFSLGMATVASGTFDPTGDSGGSAEGDEVQLGATPMVADLRDAPGLAGRIH